MTDSIRFILAYPNVWTPFLAIIIGVITAFMYSQSVAENILRWFMLLTVGLLGIEGFIMHAFFGDYTAKLIGWTDSPFQFEVAIANLSFGVLGILAFVKRHFEFYLATGIGFAIWLFGDGIGHVYQMVVAHNFAPYNAGTIVFTDLLLPVFTLLLLAFAKRRIR